MPNPSAPGGALLPAGAVLEGDALVSFLQEWVVALTGLDGKMVRPRWQAEPPNIPDAGVAWAAIGIEVQTSDEFPFVKHNPAAGGSDELQRHGEITLLSSFYDLGEGGLADHYAKLLRDGSA